MEEVPVVPSPKIEGQMGPDSFPFELDDSMDPLSALDGANVEDRVEDVFVISGFIRVCVYLFE